MPPAAARPFDSTHREASDALSLVREYLVRDANGELLRMGPDSWIAQVQDTASRMEGGDAFTAIRESGIDSSTRHGDTVFVFVSYGVLGDVEQDLHRCEAGCMRIVAHNRTEHWTFPVILRHEGWRIITPDIDQHVSASYLLEQTDYGFTEADRTVLQAAVSR